MVTPLLLTLLGCDPYAGTWVLYLELTKSPNKDQIGQDATITTNLYPLADGRYEAEISGVMLTGTIEANEIDLDYTVKDTFSSNNCDEYSQMASYGLEGTISPDAGFDGTLSYVSESSTKGCGGDDDESNAYEYSAEGVKLNAYDELHPSGSGSTMAWGYVP